MKLNAAILIAVTNAQRDGRQREKETPSTSDNSFADYFGQAFGDYGDYGAGFNGDAFGDSADASYDAFNDLSFGDYGDNYDGAAIDVNSAQIEEDVAAAVAAEPVRPGAQDEGKTLFPGNTAASNDRTNSQLAAYCWVSSGYTTTDWARNTDGRWDQCLGEASACEVKVVRDLSIDNSQTNSANIVQVTSKCANESSCVANMKQNFNPGTSANGMYNLYTYQACKPFSGLGARFKSNNERSVCFFCVEPCATNSSPAGANCIGPDNATQASANADGAPANAVAVGIGQGGANVNIDIFDDTTLATSVASGGSPGTTDNFYSTVTGTVSYTDANSITHTRSVTISKIQQLQLGGSFSG